MDKEACELVIEETNNKNDTGIEDIENKNDAGIEEIENKNDTDIEEIENKNDTGIEEIKNRNDTGIEEIENEAVTLIKDADQNVVCLDQSDKNETVFIDKVGDSNNAVGLDTFVEGEETQKIISEEEHVDSIIMDNVSGSVNIADGELEFKIEVEPDEIQNGTPNGPQEQNGASAESTEEVFEVPSYDTEFTGFLAAKEYSIETGKHLPNDANPKKTCFNCLGDHNVNECDVKKNFRDISRNRQSILGRRSANTRYHEEAQNKYGNFVPGKISDSLRFALGLREQDAPEHVYRMRTLGYPPGWLKEAEVRRSAVSLFDGNGKVLCHPEDEEGETDVNIIKYQPDKLITFPGFNAPFPDGITDDYQYYRSPQMQPHHRREEFEKFMIINKVAKYKRKKLKASDTPQSHVPDTKKSLRELADSEAPMEICSETISDSIIEFNPPLPTEALPPLPESAPLPESPQANGTSVLVDPDESEITTPVKSPVDSSLTADSSMDSTNCTEDSSDPILISSTPNERLSPSITATPTTNEIPNSFETPTSRARRVPARKHRSMSKSFTFGTCIPESITPFKTLPTPEKWGVDISDHINFDNLPDALGTWSKMKGIVKTVRNYIETMNVEEDED